MKGWILLLLLLFFLFMLFDPDRTIINIPIESNCSQKCNETICEVKCVNIGTIKINTDRLNDSLEAESVKERGKHE